MSEHMRESDEERKRAAEKARLEKVTACLGAIAAGDAKAGIDLTVEEIGIEGVHTLNRARDGKLETRRGLWI